VARQLEQVFFLAMTGLADANDRRLRFGGRARRQIIALK
jgi:hypothetical protein